MNNRITSWIIFAVLCLIWGSSFILMKYSREGLHPLQIAAVRIFFGGIVFLPFAFFQFNRISRNKLGLVILLGVTGNLLPAFLFAYAISRDMDSSLGGILNALTPLFVVVNGLLFFKNTIRIIKIAGVLIGFTGLCLLTVSKADTSFQHWDFAWLIILATFLYGLNVNMIGHYFRDQPPIPLAIVSISLMTIPTALILWEQGFLRLDFQNEIVRRSVLASIVLGIAGTAIATALFYILVKKAGGLFASLVTYGIPFVAIFWGFLDGESITLPELLCLALILFGVYLTNRREKTKSSNINDPREVRTD